MTDAILTFVKGQYPSTEEGVIRRMYILFISMGLLILGIFIADTVCYAYVICYNSLFPNIFSLAQLNYSIRETYTNQRN